jgi:hypothetical protein
MLRLSKKINYVLAAYLIIGLWYIAMFPGRLGFDSSELIRMIQRGESTDWWSGLFFWYVKILSFNGQFIFLCSFFGLAAITHSLRMFTKTLPSRDLIQDKVFFYTSLLPLFPVFGLTVSHDVFQTSGIILLLSREVSIFRGIRVVGLSSPVFAVLASIQLLTTQTGVILLVLYIVIKILQNRRLEALAIALCCISLPSLSGLGVDHVDRKVVTARVLISDLKCVAQHPEADISQSEWEFLISLAPREQWLTPGSCTSIDAQLSTMTLTSKAVVNKIFVEKYFSIVAKNPAIVVVAHLQKSRGALPPPFFQGPDNQVELDTSLPIGLNTNIALQSGPEIIHPSIDEPSVEINLRILKPLEAVAQAPVLLVNQASWFWGWGGLWLWPLLVYLIFSVKIRQWRYFLSVTSPLLLHHATMVAIGPGAFGRYYMSAILMGITASIYLFIQKLHSNDT